MNKIFRGVSLLIAVAAFAATACQKELKPVDVDPKGNEETPTHGTGQIPDGYSLYGVAEISIETAGHEAITSKDPEDYVSCTVTVDGCGIVPDGEFEGAIRGRGNSTWEWYDKKPYRLKLTDPSEFMGLPSNKDWVFLADYRDVTHMMNNVGFTMAEFLGIPYTNHSRYANVTLNGKDIGLYMITEQVEAGGHRVNVEPDGLLLALDKDDGPELSPNETNNFWSKVYRTAVAVKYPEDPDDAQLDAARASFAELETLIKNQDYAKLSAKLDMRSMVSYLMVEEIIENVEMNNGDQARSCYINYNAAEDKWYMGPVWDCDAGFDYNWGDMYDSWGYGHTYFENYKELIFGTDPFTQKGAYGGFPDFFSDLWGMPEFVQLFKSIWSEYHEDLLETVQDVIDNTYDAMADDMRHDVSLWGISNYQPASEVQKLKTWLTNRFDYLDGVIPNYKERDAVISDSTVEEDDDPVQETALDDIEIVKEYELSTSFVQDGHHHGSDISLSDSEISDIESVLGASTYVIADNYPGATDVFVVQEDGSRSDDTTTSAIGFWCDDCGNVTNYGNNSYVYADIDLYGMSFSVGKHPTICTPGDYTIKYAVAYGSKAVLINLKINVTEGD